MGNCCHIKKYSAKSPSKVVPNQEFKSWNNTWGNNTKNDINKDQEEDSEVDFLMIPEMKLNQSKKESPRVENPEKPHPLYSQWHYMEDEDHVSDASASNEFKEKRSHLELEETALHSHAQDASMNKTLPWQEDFGSGEEGSERHNEFYSKRVRTPYIDPEKKEKKRREEKKNSKKGLVTEQRLRLSRISYDKAETRTKKWKSSEGKPKAHENLYREDSLHVQDSSEISPLWQTNSYSENKSHDLLSLILRKHYSKIPTYEEGKFSTSHNTPSNKFKTQNLHSSNNSPRSPVRVPSTDNISASISYNRQGSSLSTTKPSFRLPSYPKKEVISANADSKAYPDDNQSRRTKGVRKQH